MIGEEEPDPEPARDAEGEAGAREAQPQDAAPPQSLAKL
jgi:hypothetical protein